MIDINRNNYEEYFLDFLEGNLSPSENDLLVSFLNSNPDLREELELLNELPEIRTEETFLEKSTLKKSSSNVESNTDNFNELCIAKIEGDLSDEESREFDSFIKENSKRKEEFELFKLTKVKADQNIVFKNKQELKKSTFSIFLIKNRYSIMSAAASIIIVFALFTLMPRNKNDIPLNIAELEKTKDKNVIQDEVKTEQASNKQVAEVIEPDRPASGQEIIEKEETIYKTEFIEKENVVDSVNIIDQEVNYNQYEKLTALAMELDYQALNKNIVYSEYKIYQISEPEFRNRHF